jgi:hypothetical protein
MVCMSEDERAPSPAPVPEVDEARTRADAFAARRDRALAWSLDTTRVFAAYFPKDMANVLLQCVDVEAQLHTATLRHRRANLIATYAAQQEAAFNACDAENAVRTRAEKRDLVLGILLLGAVALLSVAVGLAVQRDLIPDLVRDFLNEILSVAGGFLTAVGGLFLTRADDAVRRRMRALAGRVGVRVLGVVFAFVLSVAIFVALRDRVRVHLRCDRDSPLHDLGETVVGETISPSCTYDRWVPAETPMTHRARGFYPWTAPASAFAADATHTLRLTAVPPFVLTATSRDLVPSDPAACRSTCPLAAYELTRTQNETVPWRTHLRVTVNKSAFETPTSPRLVASTRSLDPACEFIQDGEEGPEMPVGGACRETPATVRVVICADVSRPDSGATCPVPETPEVPFVVFRIVDGELRDYVPVEYRSEPP